jgi:hypothetical protein
MKNRTQKHEKKQDMDADSTPRRKQKQNKRSAIYSFHMGSRSGEQQSFRQPP